MWTEAFKEALRATHYHPKFRLLIGTRSLQTTAIGEWEESHNEVTEICSHTDKRSEWVGDTKFSSVVGLVTFTMGARGVQLRSLEPQLAALRVTVTNEAASIALTQPVGTLARLACSINGSGYNDIFIGQYQGMEWSGGATTDLLFTEVLSALRNRSTETKGVGFTEPASDHYHWFQGTGREYTTGDVFSSPDTSIQLVSGTGLGGATDISTKRSLPPTYRHYEAWTPRGADRIYSPSTAGGNGAIFCKVDPTSGDNYYAEFTHVGVGPDYATGHGIQGTHRHFGTDTPFSSTTGTGSKVIPVCAIYGHPVAELVNLYYMGGYHASQGSGLFGNRWDGFSSPYIDWTNLTRKAGIWRRIYEYWCAYGVAVSPVNAPLRHVVTSPQRDGFSYLNRIFAKFGVFPTWRQGGYTVGMILDQGSMKREGLWRARIPEHRIINVSYTQVDSSNKQVYDRVRFTNVDTYSTGVGGYTTPSAGFSTTSQPVISQLEVSTNMATTEAAADAFGKFWSNAIGSPWYSGSPAQRATVVLQGLRWANLALGDLVSFDIPWIDVRNHPHGFRGPADAYIAGSGTGRHILDGHRGSATDAELPARTWVVVGSHPDWLGGTTTLELAKESY